MEHKTEPSFYRYLLCLFNERIPDKLNQLGLNEEQITEINAYIKEVIDEAFLN